MENPIAQLRLLAEQIAHPDFTARVPALAKEFIRLVRQHAKLLEGFGENPNTAIADAREVPAKWVELQRRQEADFRDKLSEQHWTQENKEAWDRWWSLIHGLRDAEKTSERVIRKRVPATDRAATTAKATRAKIRLSKGGDIVYVDDKPCRLNGEHAIAFVRMLKAKRGSRVMSTEFLKLGIRADREWRKLPKLLRSRISKPGKGGKGYILQ